jgi:hypothetical protein
MLGIRPPRPHVPRNYPYAAETASVITPTPYRPPRTWACRRLKSSLSLGRIAVHLSSRPQLQKNHRGEKLPKWHILPPTTRRRWGVLYGAMQSKSDKISSREPKQDRFDDDTIVALKELGAILLAIRRRLASEKGIINPSTYDQSTEQKR